MSNLFGIPVTTIDGNEATMSDWAGHVLLIVNTASECGFADQYDDLQGLFDKLASHGFFVLDFPCNQFGGQEPGSAEEIKRFCQCKFGVTFPLFQKTEVNGDSAHSLYKLLKETPDADGEAGDMKWNFEKFVISPEGEVTSHLRSRVSPDDDALRGLIEENLPI